MPPSTSDLQIPPLNPHTLLATPNPNPESRGASSELELPYIPKQVLDCIFINALIADRNQLDEVDPAIGRMGQVISLARILSLSRARAPR